MKQVAVAAAPDEILFVLDSTIGQAAYDQARAFKDAVAVGGMRGHGCVRNVVHVQVCVCMCSCWTLPWARPHMSREAFVL